MIAAQVATSPEFRVVERAPMFTLGQEFASGASQGHYSVSRDDQRFLMIRHVSGEQPDEGDAPRYILVYNWFEELKEKVGGR